MSEPSTSAVPALDAVDQTVRSSMNEQERCLGDPEGCQYGLIALAGSPQDQYFRGVTDQLIADNLRSKPGLGAYTYSVEMIGIQLDRAKATVCLRDTVTMFDLQDPANPDDDIVFDEGELWSRIEWRMELLDGQWHITDGVLLGDRQQEPLCEF